MLMIVLLKLASMWAVPDVTPRAIYFFFALSFTAIF